jgi:hypothetical protein
MTSRAISARRKGQGKEKAVPRTQKGQTFGKRCRPKPEGINGIRDRDLKKELRLRKEGTSGRVFGKTIGLEIAKRIAASSVKIRKMNLRTLWRGRSHPKRKKRLHTE